MALPSRSPAVTIPTTMTFKPLTFLAVTTAGWMNRQQQDAMASLSAFRYLPAEVVVEPEG